MARRGSTEDSDFSPSVESNSDSEANFAVAEDSDRETIPENEINGKSNKRKTSRKASGARDSRREKSKAKEVKLPSKASILILAQVDSDGADQNVLKMDKSILARIIKALNLANHSGTGEQEAKAALRMANKLMSQHSVSQAAVLSTMTDDKEKLKKAGMSTVTLRCELGKVMKLSTWCLTVESAMDKMFDCKSYSETFGSDQKDRADFVFYGLAEQTVAAAYAFEMVYNLIMTWRLQNKEAKGISAKNAYCRGIADGLFSYAVSEKRREEQDARDKEKRRLEAAKEEEEAERRRQIERLLQMTEEDHKPLIKEGETEAKIKMKKEAGPDSSSKATTVKLEQTPDRKVRIEDVEDDEDKDFTNLSRNTTREPSAVPNFPHDGGYNSDSDSDADDLDILGRPPPYYEEQRDMDIDDPDVGSADFTGADEPSAFDFDAIDRKVKAEEVETKKPSLAEPHFQPKREPDPELKKEDTNIVKKEEVDESPWESAGQLVAFRESATVIADAFLKKEKPALKLKPGRKRPILELKDATTRKSYEQGKEDSKKIDVKRRRITREEEDVVY